jgi:hypothetical protein
MAGPSEIGFIIVPRYAGGEPTVLSEISPAEAVMEMAFHCLNLATYGERAIHVLARAADRARCYRLVRGGLEEGVKAVIQATTG